MYENGLFAAPWGTEPILPPLESRPGAGFGTAFAPSLGPKGAQHNSVSPAHAAAAMDRSDFMNAIRDQAVFAWGITGINGSLAEFGKGKPLGESLPQDGLPVWASDPKGSSGAKRDSNGWYNRSDTSGATSRSPENERASGHIFGDPGLGYSSSGTRSAGSSDGTNGTGTPYYPTGPR